MDKTAISPLFVVTLVHGTFGRGSEWTHPSSLLCRTLNERLDGGVRMEPFTWSGANSHKDRIEAGSALNAQLKSQLLSAPDAAHFVISHSHGGNVAVYAMRHGGLDGSLRGIVCLNTPFFCATPRSIGGVLSFLLLLAVAFSMITAVLAAALLVVFANLHWRQYAATGRIFEFSSLWVYALLVPVVLIAGVAAFLMIAKKAGIVAWFRRRQAELIASLQLPSVEKTPVVSLWSSSDEVYGAFSVLEGVSTIPYALLHPIFVGLSFVAFFLGFALLHMFSGFAPLEWGVKGFDPLQRLLYEANDSAKAVLSAIDGIRNGYFDTPPIFERKNYAGTPLLASFVALLQAFFLAFFLAVFALALAIAGNVTMRLLPMGLGGYRFLDSLFVRLSFTLVPVTARHNLFFDVTTDKGMLKHTIIYNDADLLEHLMRAIKETAAPADGGRELSRQVRST